MKNKILEKLLAIILIFTLTFANFAFITKSYASTFADALFGVNNDTGSKNVNFDSYFEIDGQTGTSIISDVNNKELFINIGLDVNGNGYLKDGKIELLSEKSDINFDVKENIKQETEIVSSEEQTQNESEVSNEQEIANTETPQQENLSVENEDEKHKENEEKQESNSVNEIEQHADASEVQDTNEINTNETELNQEENNLENVQGIENEETANEENIEQKPENNEVSKENVEEPKEKTVEELVDQEESIEKFENNVFYLNPIYGTSTVNVQIPIEYKNEKYVNENNISQDNLIVFSGIYVDDKGKEVEVSKQITLNVTWMNERKLDIGEETTKYINYGAGIILQTVEKVNTSSEENTLPIKQTELEIEVPKLKDAKPSKITVVANTTKGTNGKEAGEVVFSEENWEYNEEENKLKIKVENTKQTVKVNEYEDEYLQEEGKELVEEERYLNSSGIDEYLVTYAYENVDVTEDEAVTVESKVKAKMTTVSGIESEEKVTENSKEYSYNLEGQSGDIVSLNIENKNKEISKAYTYVNYNNEGKYETQIQEDMLVNISYKDIVEGIELVNTENTYVDKSGNVIENNDIYYKTISITKENFDSILGENGEIKVKEESGNQIAVINKDSEVNENGIIEIGFEEKYSRLSFEITKPIAEGNIVISTVKALGKASIAKEDLAQIEKVESKTAIRATYNYVEEKVEVGNIETETKLIDTATEASLLINRNSLSTVEENKDVEMRIELNNAKETSDIYGHSEFAVDLPEYIENIELTNVNLLYGEGLEISNYEVEGRTIRVTLDGKQEGINSGVLTNGTNIVMNANIKVNLFAPAKTDLIKLSYTNSEATNYVGEGKKEVEVSYSAPTGLVAVNTISNYDDSGSTITSVKQGKKEGIIQVYGGQREATQEIIVMNNNNNTVSNISILGRIPFVGVKDIKSGEELGTTVDSRITSAIVSNEANKGNFTIYYSENGEASKDLNDENNGWSATPESLENIKSYLIIPEDTEYFMEKYETLKFSYNFYIPENLIHNEFLYGTFAVNYRNNSEVAKLTETAVPDLVGLTTGQGPELKLTITPSKEEVKEYEEFYVTVAVENVGDVQAENVSLQTKYDTKVLYQRTELLSEDMTEEDIKEVEEYYDTNNELQIHENVIGKKCIKNLLNVGEKAEIKIYLKANPLKNSDEYEKINSEVSENDTEDVRKKLQTDQIEIISLLEAKDLGITKEEKTTITLKEGELKVEERLKINGNIALDENGKLLNDYVAKKDDELILTLEIENLSTSNKINNIVINKILAKELSFKNANYSYEYDENNRSITCNIPELEANSSIKIEITLKVNELEENVSGTEVSIYSSIKGDNIGEYKTNEILLKIGKPVLVITQTTDNANTYVKEGDIVKYNYSVKNEGTVAATNVDFTEVIPDGLVVTTLSYKIDDVETTRQGSWKNSLSIREHIAPGAELLVNLETVALSLDGASEKSVTNYANLTSNEHVDLKSNEITHIIEASDKSAYEVADTNTSTMKEFDNNIAKTYKISGVAWFDSNRNGMRDKDEKNLNDIVVKLINNENGSILNTTTTDSKGEYVFTGIKNGNYLVIFEYDNSKYTVTTYKKEGVIGNVNSDAILTTINQDGKSKEGAVTDIIKINDVSVSNIDIGLILSDKFDLKLDKTISKVVVQTSKDTITDNYDNVKLAKTEIAAKLLSGATVYVEYTITVSNVGDIAGYAKKIVDYLPQGMTFNSSLESNKDWYTGQDGNLYSEKLADKELKSGETVSLKLVLTKQMNSNNTGIVNNIAEIYEDYNKYGTTDVNSIPGNKLQSENDTSSADVVISVKTGEIFIYISVIVTSILLGSIVIFVTYNKIVISKRKWVM